jgi:hypothetical protein
VFAKCTRLSKAAKEKRLFSSRPENKENEGAAERLLEVPSEWRQRSHDPTLESMSSLQGTKI